MWHYDPSSSYIVLPWTLLTSAATCIARLDANVEIRQIVSLVDDRDVKWKSGDSTFFGYGVHMLRRFQSSRARSQRRQVVTYLTERT